MWLVYSVISNHEKKDIFKDKVFNMTASTLITRVDINHLTQSLTISLVICLIIMVLNKLISKQILTKNLSKQKKKRVSAISLYVSVLSQNGLFLSLANLIISIFLLATMEQEVVINDYLVFSGLVYFFVSLVSLFTINKNYRTFVKKGKKRPRKKALNRLDWWSFFGISLLSQLSLLLITYVSLFSKLTLLFYLYTLISSLLLLSTHLIIRTMKKRQ